jgi:hypothetical protein
LSLGLKEGRKKQERAKLGSGEDGSIERSSMTFDLGIERERKEVRYGDRTQSKEFDARIELARTEVRYGDRTETEGGSIRRSNVKRRGSGERNLNEVKDREGINSID